MQYFKHPKLTHFLYDRFLVAYGRLPWKDEVPNYFASFFYAELFVGMKPDSFNIHSIFCYLSFFSMELVPILFEMHILNDYTGSI